MSAPSKIAATLRNLLNISRGGETLAELSRALVRPRTNALALYCNNAGELRGADGGSVDVRGRRVVEDFSAHDTADQVAVLLATGAAASGATGALHHIYTPGGNVLAGFPLGAGQTLLPAIVASGLDIGADQTATEGWEIASHCFGASGRPFVVGNSPAFYFKATITLADVSGVAHMLIGFRRAAAVQATYTDYADYASIGAIAGAIYLKTGNDGTDVSTDTTDTWADTATKELAVYVSATGVVTYTINGTAPTTTAAFTFDDGDPVVPFVRFLHDTDLCDTVVIGEWEVGLQ